METKGCLQIRKSWSALRNVERDFDCVCDRGDSAVCVRDYRQPGMLSMPYQPEHNSPTILKHTLRGLVYHKIIRLEVPQSLFIFTD